MLIDPNGIEILVFCAGAFGLLLVAACVDRYWLRRRDTALNAAYLARFHAYRIDSPRHPIDRNSGSARFPANSGFIQLPRKEQNQLSAPGFYSRRTVLRDAGGRIVAAHFEAFVVADFAQDASVFESPRLRLTN